MVINMEKQIKEASNFKFGSAEWVKTMSENVLIKALKNIPLDNFEKSFVEVESERKKRILEVA